MNIQTASSNITLHVEDHEDTASGETVGLGQVHGHGPCQIGEMHHYGNPDGKHYCPTGFLWCYQHADVAGYITKDGHTSGFCHKWGEDDE